MNIELLVEIIKEKRYKLNDIANVIGMSRMGFYKKIKGQSEFKVSEINKISNFLNLSKKQREDIFFADCVYKNVNIK